MKRGIAREIKNRRVNNQEKRGNFHCPFKKKKLN
jgi:hypothetical protein